MLVFGSVYTQNGGLEKGYFGLKIQTGQFLVFMLNFNSVRNRDKMNHSYC